jgi:hypothetical protein
MVTASRVGAVALTVIAARLVLGVWPTSVLLAAGCLWWGVRAWYRWENRTRRRVPARALVPYAARQSDRPEAEAGHAAFARALAVVALRYLDHCEQEAHRP